MARQHRGRGIARRAAVRRAAGALGVAVLGALGFGVLGAVGPGVPAAAAAKPAPSQATAAADPAQSAPTDSGQTPFPSHLLDLMAASGAAPAVAPSATPSATEASAVQEFGACLNGGGEADMLLLVDESSSLIGTDPGAARVASATYFVDELADYVDDGGQPIDLQLGVFAHGAETIMPWTALDGTSLGGIHGSIDSLGDRVEGFDTDYWTALDSAQREMNAKAQSADGTTRCQAIVMFTDGKLDYFPRTTAAEQQAYGTEKPFAPGIELTTQAAADQVRDIAREDICRDGGLADQLTSSAIKIFGIGLSADPANASDFNLFQAIVEGTGDDGTTCGSLGEGTRGDFFHANDIDDLLFAFDSIVDEPVQIDGGICQQAPCSAEAHEFVLDTSTPDVSILAQADVPDLQVTVLMPGGELIDFPMAEHGVEQTLTVAGATFEYTWETANTISIDAARADADETAWMGLWQLAFTDPSGQSEGKSSRSNIHIAGSLRPSLDGLDDPVEFHAGDTVDLQPSITDRNDGVIDATTIPGDMTYTATLVDADGTTFDVLATSDKGAIAAAAPLDLSDAAVGAAELRLALDITTAPAQREDGSTVPGTELATALVTLPVTILTPANFPVVASALDFGSASGTVDLTATLAVSGDGCVWLADDAQPAVIAAPDGIGAVSISAGDHSSAESCFTAGSGDGIELRLRTDDPGNGTINGTVPVMLGSSEEGVEPIQVDVPFTANLERPLNALNFVLVLIAAPILGIGIPLLLLYLAKWFISKVPARPLTATTIDVSVEHGQVLRGGSRFELGPGDLVNTVPIPAGGGRTLRIGDITLRAKTGLAPTGAGFVDVDAPGRGGIGSKAPSVDKTGTRARLPLAVHNTWVVLHAAGAPAESAQVLVLVGGDSTAAARTELENDINRRLPDLLEKLVREQGGAAPGPGAYAAAASPFGGGAPQQQQGSPFQGGGSPFQGGGSGSPFQGGGSADGSNPWRSQ